MPWHPRMCRTRGTHRGARRCRLPSAPRRRSLVPNPLQAGRALLLAPQATRSAGCASTCHYLACPRVCCPASAAGVISPLSSARRAATCVVFNPLQAGCRNMLLAGTPLLADNDDRPCFKIMRTTMAAASQQHKPQLLSEEAHVPVPGHADQQQQRLSTNPPPPHQPVHPATACTDRWPCISAIGCLYMHVEARLAGGVGLSQRQQQRHRAVCPTVGLKQPTQQAGQAPAAAAAAHRSTRCLMLCVSVLGLRARGVRPARRPHPGNGR